MKILAISDLHTTGLKGLGRYVRDCALVLVAGDFTEHGRTRGVEQSVRWVQDVFRPWCASFPDVRFCVVPGDHDLFAERRADEIRWPETVTYLDPLASDPAARTCEVAGLKIYGVARTPYLKGGERVLEIDHLKIGYDSVLAEVTMEIRRGDRVAVIGPNGTGKSTFVKTLMEQVPPLGGSYLFGHQIEVGYFDQQLAQFSSGKTVLEELWDENPDLDRTAVRSVLGQFLFSADDVFKTVDVLSGGEKVRLSLAKLLLEHSNMLILDEPTNHLDIPGKEALEESLKDFSGTLLFVSHDRYFISRLATALLVLENDGSCRYLPMTYEEYAEKEAAKEETTAAAVAVQKKQTDERRQLSPESRRREIARLEKEITAKEEELEAMKELRFEPEYYHDYQKMNLLEADIDDIHSELARLMDRWEELSEEG